MARKLRVFCRLKRKKRALKKGTLRGYKVIEVNDVNQADEGKEKEMLPGKKAHVIVIGNEKGGSGKTTTAMHINCSLLHLGFEVGIIDLDLRQRSFTRYMENRLSWMDRRDVKLLMPRYARVRKSENPDLSNARAEDIAMTNAAIDRLSDADFIVIDCPGADSPLSRAAHARADTVITPLNDSFVDFDLLAHVDPDTMEIVAPSVYSEMVWESRKNKARSNGGNIDWIVMRNRQSQVNARNKEKVGGVLNELSQRFGFRLAAGFTERVIYRELFLAGLTLLDLSERGTGMEMSMSHLSARQEVRNLLSSLQLPHVPVYSTTAKAV
ncbi:MAG: division plane positioning ATPase MipZ [Pseudomonadota bacterium]